MPRFPLKTDKQKERKEGRTGRKKGRKGRIKIIRNRKEWKEGRKTAWKTGWQTKAKKKRGKKGRKNGGSIKITHITKSTPWKSSQVPPKKLKLLSSPDCLGEVRPRGPSGSNITLHVLLFNSWTSFCPFLGHKYWKNTSPWLETNPSGLTGAGRASTKTSPPSATVLL